MMTAAPGAPSLFNGMASAEEDKPVPRLLWCSHAGTSECPTDFSAASSTTRTWLLPVGCLLVPMRDRGRATIMPAASWEWLDPELGYIRPRLLPRSPSARVLYTSSVE